RRVSSSSSVTLGTVVLAFMVVIPVTHAWIGSSQCAVCGSAYGFAGGGPSGLSLFVSIRMECHITWPRRGAGALSGMPGGSLKYSFGSFASAASMNCRHIGATMYPAISVTIALLSLFPAQTATAMFGAYPTVQASRDSFVVPVFAATS